MKHEPKKATIFSDYTAKTWDLYVEGEKIGSYGFNDASATADAEYGVKGGGTVADIAITTTDPVLRDRATLLIVR